MPNCCEPCNNGTPSSFEEIVVPAGDSATVSVPTTIDPATGRREISCAVINRNGQQVDAVLSPDRDLDPVDCTLIQPGNNPVFPWGPFIDPGVITIPTYVTDLILCNSGTEDVTILVEFFEGCGCGEFCDPNLDPQPVTVEGVADVAITDPVEVEPAAAATAVATNGLSAAAGNVAAGAAQVTITNTGASPGSVQGGGFPADASITLNAFLDPVTNTFYRLPQIDYDATGTQFVITTVV